jgi:four helix bundle protein
VGDYRQLQVWQRAHQLTLDVYQATRALPKEELFGLTSQLRRASSSIPANIAEGCGRNSDAELARYLGIALGSTNELDYHLLLARDLAYLPSPAYEHLAAETQGVAKILTAFINRLRQSKNRQFSANSQQPTANSQQPIADSR